MNALGSTRRVTATVIFVLATITCQSESRAFAEEVPGGVALAESQFGNGKVSGAIRQGRHGLEVQLPGGTWIECRRNCSETLRVETVDFWQAQGKVTNECGILGCLQLEYPRR